MKKSLVLVAVALLCLAAYRAIWTLPSPMGSGRYLDSPDKRFIAFASTMTSRSYFAGERQYYEFRIEDQSRRAVRNIQIQPQGEAMISWRDDGLIEWSSDSKEAIFAAQDIRIVLNRENKN